MINKVCLLLVFALLSMPCAVFGAGPNDCLVAIDDTIENGNTDGFLELVELDGILNNALDVFLAEIQKPDNANSLPPMFALMLTQAANQQQIRQLLLQEARAFVLNGIASGAFAGKKLAAPQQEGVLAPLFANASKGRKEIRNPGEAVKTGNEWLMPFGVFDYGNGHEYTVIGRFGKPEGRIRLLGIENLDQLFAQIHKESLE